MDLREFETLMVHTSARLVRASAAVRPAIESALAKIRTFFHADLSGLVAVDPGRSVATVVGMSYGDGVPHLPEEVNIVAMFPWTYQRTVVDAVPLVMAVADQPPEAAVDRASNAALGVRRIMVVPVITEKAVSHLIVINAMTEGGDWSADYVPRLRLLGEMMVAALQRQEAFDALRDSEARLREQTLLLAAAVDAAELGFSVAAAGETAVLMDTRMQDVLGIAPEDAPRALEAWMSRVAPADAGMVGDVCRQLGTGEIERAVVEYRYDHSRRGGIWVRHTARRLEDPAAGRAKMITAVQDITERRGREEALKEAHEEVKRLRDRLERENVYLRKEVAHAAGGDMVTGRSSATAHALMLAEQVAAADSTVLLVGETGTGKERFASFIHKASPRRGRHMVRVNCSAIPSALIESELFGREKGAYTGALSRQIGRFELANGSTLFLDEIGDLPLEVQVKLLRVLQERTLERLGSPAPIGVDVRIIAATNRDLEAAVRQGTFRSDLYYRLNVFPIVVPPLRERLDDVPALVETLVEELAGVIRKRFTAVDRASMEALKRYQWPGNVRELRNMLERAMILSPGPTLTVTPPRASGAEPTLPAETPAREGRDLRNLERGHILRVLEETGWRIRGRNAAADVLGLKPTTLEARMAKLGIHRPGTVAK